jgi:hypothetical protein
VTWYTPDQKKRYPPQSNPPGGFHLRRSSCITLRRTAHCLEVAPCVASTTFWTTEPHARPLISLTESTFFQLLRHPFPLILYCTICPFTLSFCPTFTLSISLLSLLTLTYFMASTRLALSTRALAYPRTCFASLSSLCHTSVQSYYTRSVAAKYSVCT